MFNLAIEVCFENYFRLIHTMFLLLGSMKSVYFFLGHPVELAICNPRHPASPSSIRHLGIDIKYVRYANYKNQQSYQGGIRALAG